VTGNLYSAGDSWAVKPVVVCSRCLGFQPCRYNGQVLNDPLIDALHTWVDFITPCPESDIGLGIPRHPVRIVEKDEKLYLIQLITEKNVTEEMKRYSLETLSVLTDVDGFILKSRSPSCGIFDVKRYPSISKTASTGKGAGFYGGAVTENFQGLAIEDEVRLGNEKIRHHFLTKLFTLADFRRVQRTSKASELVDFQSRNKLLLMAYNQEEMKQLGRIVAAQAETGIDEAVKLYRGHLIMAMQRGVKHNSHINVLQHAFGYVSSDLSKDERVFFLETLEMFREDRVQLVTLLNLMMSWILRFKVEYLHEQTYFNPYPAALTRHFDRYRSKDYWKERGVGIKTLN